MGAALALFFLPSPEWCSLEGGGVLGAGCLPSSPYPLHPPHAPVAVLGRQMHKNSSILLSHRPLFWEAGEGWAGGPFSGFLGHSLAVCAGHGPPSAAAACP